MALPNSRVQSEFFAAVKAHDWDKARDCVRRGADVNCPGMTEVQSKYTTHPSNATALIHALDADWPLAAVSEILALGADANQVGTISDFEVAAVHWALARSTAPKAMVSLLAEHGADLDAVVGAHPDALGAAGANLLNAACRRVAYPLLAPAPVEEYIAVARELISRGAKAAKADGKGNTAAHYAAIAEECELCEELLGSGADPNAVNAEGNTPLMEAFAEEDSFQVSDRILERRIRLLDVFADAGVVFSQTDAERKTLAHHLAAHKHNAFVENAVVRSGHALNKADPSGAMPLHKAVGARWPAKAIEAVLAASTVDVNVQDRRGMTALHIAAEMRDDGTYNVLVAAGADEHLSAGSWKTPLSIWPQRNQAMVP